MKKHIALLSIFCLAAAGAGAETVECTPGTLGRLIQSPETVTELTLTGTADASDLFFIGEKLTALRSLDLAGITIAAYQGERVGLSSSWPAATIPDGAFAGSEIESVVLPASPIAVGNYAFASTALTAVNVPATVTQLGESVFADCRSLRQATVAVRKSGGYTFRNCGSLEKVTLTGTGSIGTADFAGCSALASVEGSDGISAIGPRAFEGCTSLKDIALGNRLGSIGERAFAGSGLAALAIPSSAPLDTIHAWAFAGCKSLAEVSLPDGLEAVGRGSFFECTALTGIHFPGHTTELEPYVLKDDSAITELTLSDNTEYISAYALKGLSSVTTLTIPGSVTGLGDHAMEGMTGLQSITATDLGAVPELGRDVFKGIDRSAVSLKVDGDVAESFRSAPQWQEFRINDVSSAEGIAAAPGGIRITGRFAGKTLEVKASGSKIARLELFDADGRLLSRMRPGSESVAFDTSEIGTDVFIISCLTADGTAATLKLVR